MSQTWERAFKHTKILEEANSENLLFFVSTIILFQVKKQSSKHMVAILKTQQFLLLPQQMVKLWIL